MCNLSEGVWEKGIQQGILESIQNLMETMGWSEQESMDSLKIPKRDQAMYAKRLSKKEVL